MLTPLLVGLAFVAGCSGESDGDDEDNDDSGGSSAVGGSAGNGGTGGNGGTQPTGGSGPGQALCTAYCERRDRCAGVHDGFCFQQCLDSEADADSLGCLAPFRALVDCLSSLDVCPETESDCPAEAQALQMCATGGGTADCAEPGAAPANADCVPICQRVQACPEAMPTADCTTTCAEGANQAAATGCTVEYQRANGCLGTCTDICNFTSADCASEMGAYSDCLVNYCTANPGSPGCGA